ncbi:MAG: DUF4390 domain-containing protein [Candidatus Zixiibacteriota bacterium]|nr:MAG: DUF4390 domain-containing protein [candidate division Zixibacteria bacterium]
MKRSESIRLWLFGPILLLALGSARAQEHHIPFDIFLENSNVTVWVDYSSLLSAEDSALLHDGIDILMTGQFKLVSPRRLFGNRLVAQEQNALHISYGPVTETYELLLPPESWFAPRVFAASADLRQYLRDSITVTMEGTDSLDRERRYSLQLRITTTALTDLNTTAGSSEQTDAPASPIRLLFREFLRLTGYGRRVTEAKSISFSLRDLRGED